MNTQLEWLQERQNGIGGSDAAAAVGLSPWTTPYELYMQKTEPVRVSDPTEPMVWGTLLEPVIRQRYSDVTGFDVIVPRSPVVHPVHPYARCNLDGFANNDRVLQVKTARTSDHWGEPYSDEVPEHYMIQVQHEMGCAGTSLADFAVLFGGNQFQIYTVKANPELQEALFEAEGRFWQCVLDRQPPDAITAGDIRQRWPSSIAGKYVDADPKTLVDHAELLQVRDRLQELEQRKERLEASLMKTIRDAEGIIANGKLLATWKHQQQVRLDAKAIKTSRPELFEQFATTIHFRKFLAKKVQL